jgi:hypothetical protein
MSSSGKLVSHYYLDQMRWLEVRTATNARYKNVATPKQLDRRARLRLFGCLPSSRPTQPQGRSGAMRKMRPPIVPCMPSCVSIHRSSGGSPAIRLPRAMRNPGGPSHFHSTSLARSASATDRMPSISSAGTFSR